MQHRASRTSTGIETLSQEDISHYCQRIGYQGSWDPTLSTLQKLHRAHLYTIPFENLDPIWGRRGQLCIPQLLEKIVRQRRGGFCFEVNGLLASLLASLGYEVGLLSGRVIRPGGNEGPPFDHLLLAVQVPGSLDRWLADVGFGDSFRDPVRWQEGEMVCELGSCYSLHQGLNLDWEVMQTREGIQKTLFRFDQVRHHLAEFEPMFHFHQTSPESSFTHFPLCTLAYPDGRITLSKNRLSRKTWEQGSWQVQEERLDPDQILVALQEHFGMIIPAHDAHSNLMGRNT